jgi:hypothetical protein
MNKMGYMHIDNLYKYIDILNFKECYALEKVHGTSSHIKYDELTTENGQPKLTFFAGGASHDEFVKLFDPSLLLEKFKELGQSVVTVYGEACGGRVQKMKETYGPSLRFVAFDVLIGEHFLNVPTAEKIVNNLGLEFVPYEKVSTNLEDLNRERDRDSEVAIRWGLGTGHIREGVVLRPLEEYSRNNGKRIIAKHKRDEFKETKTSREVDPTKLEVLRQSQEIADEWVTETRLQHVLDKFPADVNIESCGLVIKAMLEDITREAAGEIELSSEADRAIAKATAALFKKFLNQKMETLAS